MYLNNQDRMWVKVLLLLCTFWAPASQADPLEALLLLSYEPVYPTAQFITEYYVNDALNEEIDQPIQLNVEYLDTDLGFSQEYLADYRALLETKQQDEHYDVVIVVGDSALNLAANSQQNLFNDSPLIFLNVSNQQLVSNIQSQMPLSGVMGTPPMHAHVQLLQQLYPEQKTYYVIDDGLKHRQYRRDLIEQAAQDANIDLNYLRLNQMSWQELGSALNLIEQQPIILLSAYQDRLGHTKHISESTKFITQHASSLIWHPWQAGIGLGLAGGVMVDIKKSAQIAARMTAQVLNNKALADIPIVEQPPLITLVDADQALNYGIALNQFPKGTEFINKPVSFWYTYGAFIIISISTISLILVLSFLAWRATLKKRDIDKKLTESNNFISYLLDSIPDLIFFKDAQGVYRFSNHKFALYAQKDPIGETDFDIFDKSTADFFREQDKITIALGQMNLNEEWLVLPDGESKLYETRKNPIYNSKGELQGIFGLSRDITDLNEAQRGLEFIANHDSLTGLINRIYLNDKIDFAIKSAHRNQEQLAVIYLDLDRFKDVNDSIGHDVGDLLLKEVANRLRGHTRESDICARLGGDEFVIVLTQTSNVEQVNEKAESLLQEIAQPYQLNNHLISLYSSAGISIYPADGGNSTELVKHADAALHEAKRLGRNRYCHYEPSLTRHIYSRLVLDNDLRQALKNKQFFLAYQPMVFEGSKTIRRIEALVRWQHPERGLIPPLEFIPIAETSGLISDLGFWIIENACQQFLLWKQHGKNPELERLAINISPIQINSNFAKKVTRLLKDMSFNPTWLEMEVTEGLMMSDTKDVIDQIEALKALGVHFSIDDFGTGYSSLGKLKSMPVSTLKIDKSFIHDINVDNSDYKIVHAITQMAKSLNLDVVAEGIETKEQADLLLDIGCQWLQGYYFFRPISPEELNQYFDL